MACAGWIEERSDRGSSGIADRKTEWLQNRPRSCSAAEELQDGKEERKSKSICGCESVFFFASRRRHTRLQGDWSSDVCSSDLYAVTGPDGAFTIAEVPPGDYTLVAWHPQAGTALEQKVTVTAKGKTAAGFQFKDRKSVV